MHWGADDLSCRQRQILACLTACAAGGTPCACSLPADAELGHLRVLIGTCWRRMASPSWRACPRCSSCLRAACGALATATAWAGGRRRATALGRTSGGRTARCTVRSPAARARRRLIRPPYAGTGGAASVHAGRARRQVRRWAVRCKHVLTYCRGADARQLLCLTCLALPVVFAASACLGRTCPGACSRGAECSTLRAHT